MTTKTLSLHHVILQAALFWAALFCQQLAKLVMIDTAASKGKLGLPIDNIPTDMVYAGFHFPELSLNDLILAALDPVSKIPEFKGTAMKVELVAS
jgi:hypothetical protein